MTDAKNSIAFYSALADRANRTGVRAPASHATLFQPSDATVSYYQALYLDQRGKGNKPARRPGDATCIACEQFNLSNRKNINKGADINLGKTLEVCFQDFLNETLKKTSATLAIERADSEDLHNPDLKVTSTPGGPGLMYCECKVIFRPFIKISTYVNPDYECYANSLTLDLENGKKLREQRDRVEKQLGVDRVAYVYWYDLPCIKGVFWMPAARVYQLMDKQVPYARQLSGGDFRDGRKVGATNKLYLPLAEMDDGPSLVERMLSLAKS